MRLYSPKKQISLIAGLIEAYQTFFMVFHLSWMTPVMAILIVLGGMSSVGAWLIGPARGLMVASEDGYLPRMFVKCNRFGVPQRILLNPRCYLHRTMFIIFVDAKCQQFRIGFLSALTAQLALIVYILFFAAAFRLRQKTASH